MLKTEKEKELLVFRLIISGLEDVFSKDKLDKTILEKTIFHISKNGLDTELEFKTLENKKYLLKVTYFSRSMETLNPVFIELFDKVNSKSNKIEIGKVGQLQLYPWLRKISLSNSKIIIKSSDSLWANVVLKDKPKYIEFGIDEILK